MTPHLASLWNRGLWQIGNGLLKGKKNASSCDMGEGVRQVQVSTVAAIWLVTTQFTVFSFASVNFMFIGSRINLSQKPSDQ